MTKSKTNRKGVKITAIALAVLMTLAAAPSARAADSPFSDVPSTHWAYSEIMEAYADGAVQGTSTNTYNPNGNVTMAQFIAILTRAFCSEQVEASTANDTWYAANYEAADSYDLFVSVPNKGPDAEVTREVMAQITYNLIGSYPQGPTFYFNEQKIQAIKDKIPDSANISPSMSEAAAICYALGVITGVDSAGRFSPQGRMTRAQTAVIYVRLKKLLETGTGLASQPETSTGTSAETSGATLTNGQPVTVENVLALMEEYKNGKEPGTKAKEAGFTSYRHLATYPAYNGYSLSPFGNGTECAMFAFAFFDDIFGTDAPIRTITNPADVRPGDMIRFSGHWCIATGMPFLQSYSGGTFYKASHVDGGSTGEISWGSGSNIGRALEFYTRYPE